jgi:hypothetical protein
MKAPNSKFQVPKKHQASSVKVIRPLPSFVLELGHWNFSGAWNLEFGIWNFDT